MCLIQYILYVGFILPHKILINNSFCFLGNVEHGTLAETCCSGKAGYYNMHQQN